METPQRPLHGAMKATIADLPLSAAVFTAVVLNTFFWTSGPKVPMTMKTWMLETHESVEDEFSISFLSAAR